jgi:hypothetical protein
MLDGDSIEDFIRENKEKFDVYRPPENHLEKFLMRLNYSIRHIMSITPYLLRLGIATILIFAASILVWNNFIRKDRNEISLKNKISVVINRIKTY